MNKLKCCVIDDEPLALELIAGYVRKTEFLELTAVFESASQAVKTIISEDIDVVFLDIQMPELNGIEFARVIPQKCNIIFVTAFEKYAIDGFRACAVDYLVKPVNYSEFLNAANKVLNLAYLKEKARADENDVRIQPCYIIVKSEYKMVQIPVRDILYIEGLKDYIKIFVENESRPVMSRMSVKSFAEKLPSTFIRVHRSFIVNTEKIKIIERNRIIFGKEYIPISDSYKDDFLDYLSQHMISRDFD